MHRQCTMKIYWKTGCNNAYTFDLRTVWIHSDTFYSSRSRIWHTLNRRLATPNIPVFNRSQTQAVQSIARKSCPCVKFIKHHTWRYMVDLLTLALDRGGQSVSRPDRFKPKERAPGTHCIVGWVGPTVGLDTGGKRKFSCPSRAWSPSIQPVACLYINWAWLVTLIAESFWIIMMEYVKRMVFEKLNS